MIDKAPGRQLRRARLQRRLSPLGLSTTLLAALLCLPLMAVTWLALTPAENPWPHLVETVLPRYLYNTAVLMVGVGLLSTAIGMSLAWLLTYFEFPGRRFFDWALLLPFSVPAYIMAYVYTDFLGFTGPVQQWLLHDLGLARDTVLQLPQVRSLPGAVLIFSLVLYPYVMLTTRAGLENLSENLILAARSLGATSAAVVWRVILPALRPSIVVGVSLVLMETLNDYGTVSYFAIPTLTAGLFDAWLSMGNVGGAAQIALLLVSITLLLVLMEWLSRNRGVRKGGMRKSGRIPRTRLTGWRRALALFWLTSVLTAGFLIPFGVLFTWSIRYFDANWNSSFLQYASNSVTLGLITVLTLSVLALLIAYAQRSHSRDRSLTTRLAMLGYAMPGAVLAVGVLVPLGAFDNAVDAWFRDHWGVSTGLLLSGSMFALVYAYGCRFFTVSFGSVESGLAQITPSMDHAARTLGCNSRQILVRVHLPLLRPALLSAAIIVFVDVIKELPATLILRPFNFETLATYVYQLASDERIHQCSLAALLIVVAGMVPAIWLSRLSRPHRRDTAELLTLPDVAVEANQHPER